MRIVFDTNVLLAAFATHGLCESLFAACLQAQTIVVSEHILGELRRHLKGKLKMPERQIAEIEKFLRAQCEIVMPVAVERDACPDADDLPVLGTALASKADALVTGDAELRTCKTIGKSPIVSPRELYELLRAG